MHTVGALIFPGFELLDLYGPLEMFGWMRADFTVCVVAQKPGAVESSACALGYATHKLQLGAKYDILLIPGGSGTRREVDNPHLIDWLAQTAAHSTIVATVCTGAALLARTGCLNNRRATTNKRAFDWVSAQGPSVAWQRRARWVADEKYWTSSGVSAGMDMTLALIAHLHSDAKAREVAAAAEYVWNDDPDDDPFALV